MRQLSALALLASLLFSPLSAHAWGAIAYNNSVAYTSYGFDSETDAIQAAMSACQKRGSRCKLAFDGGRRGGALVVYEADDGWSFGFNVDPAKADSSASKDCVKNYKNCRRYSAEWDDGATWGAFATGASASYYSYNGYDQRSAEEDALKMCEERTEEKGSCSIAPGFTTKAKAYFSAAASKSVGNGGFGTSSESKAKADELAMSSCAKHEAKPSDCKVVDRYLNDGPKPSPAAMKTLAARLAKAKAEKQAQGPATQTTVVQNAYSCHTVCENQACVSRFPDGKVLRWTAPMVFEFGQWKIDTSSCGIR